MLILKAYGGQGVECSSLNVIGSHKIIKNDTIRRSGLIEVSVTLFDKVCHCEDRFWGLLFKVPSVLFLVYFLLPTNQDVIGIMFSCTLLSCSTSWWKWTELLKLKSVTPTKCFQYKGWHNHGVSPQQEKLLRHGLSP